MGWHPHVSPFDVWEDHDYGLISWKQRNEFGRNFDMTFGNPDWRQLASAQRLGDIPTAI